MSTDETSGATFEIGRVLGQTFGVLGRNFFLLLGLSILFSGVPTALIAAAQSPAFGIVNSENSSMLDMLGRLASLVSGVVLQGALIRVAIDDLSKRGASFGNALASGFGLILPLIGLGILMGIAQMIGIVLLVIPGLFLIVRWLVSAPALVAEEKGVTAAMGRSADLTEGSRWPIFGLVLLYIVPALLIYFGFGLLIQTTGLIYAQDIPGAATMIGLAAAIDMATGLVGAAGAAAIYIELRRVKEGVGVEELAQVFA